MTKDIASVRLISEKLRLVELLGPRPLESRRPNDILLQFRPAHEMNSYRVGLCLRGDERRAKFLVDEGTFGDGFLHYLGRIVPSVRLAQPYGISGYLVEENPAPATANRSASRRSTSDVSEDWEVGQLQHSNHPGQILSVEGRPVRR